MRTLTLLLATLLLSVASGCCGTKCYSPTVARYPASPCCPGHPGPTIANAPPVLIPGDPNYHKP